MRSQANEWAAGFSPEILAFRLLRVFSNLKAASPRRRGRVKGETGGVIDCGTIEEDGPVTWEAPAVLWADPGNGAPVTHSDAPSGANELVAGPVAARRCTELTFAPKVRHTEGRPEVSLRRQGSRMAA